MQYKFVHEITPKQIQRTKKQKKISLYCIETKKEEMLQDLEIEDINFVKKIQTTSNI